MLSRIFIQNFALIDSLEFQLKKGLQVVTGETGAGKSIILGALRLILGERADLKAIQDTQKKSIVEAEFFMSPHFQPFFEENNLDFEKNTIIRRELLPNGKSRAFVNDVPTTLDVLKNLSEQLIDIHSQFETSQLFTEEFQFEMIDGLSENKILITDYQKNFRQRTLLKKRLQEFKTQLAEAEKEADYRNFLLEELHNADLDSTDLQALEDQLSLYENAETIQENLKLFFERTDQDEVGLIDAFLDIKTKLNKVAGLSHRFTEAAERLENLFVDFKDLLFELQNKAESIDANPEKTISLKEQINAINALLQKHHVLTIEALLEIRERLEQEQHHSETVHIEILALEKELVSIENSLEKTSLTLSENRKKGSLDFQKKAEDLLKKLGLEKAKIQVVLSPDTEFNLYGKEKIEIHFQANPGFPLKPIQQAISGGERSRVMLAIKKIVSDNKALPTLILDEIDTGVSGKVADEVGKLMKEMSENRQLIVITHLAQVAAKGDNNYKVVKKEISGKTQSSIVSLTSKEKLQEIAQLLSGAEITEAAKKQAAELMK